MENIVFLTTSTVPTANTLHLNNFLQKTQQKSCQFSTASFGMLMPDRGNTPADGYRYGFNGKEMDNEVKGNGNSIDFGGRIYDSRLGKWLSVDPASQEYPSHSPYIFVLNNPIVSADLDGKRTYFMPGLGGRTTGKPNVQSINDAFTSIIGDDFVEIMGGNKPTLIGRLLHSTFPDEIKTSTYGGDILYAASRSARRPALPILKDRHIMNTVNEIVKDLHNNPLKDGEKFNLMGMSMGSINSAQAAIILLRRGTVKKIDNLILGGSPIDMESKLYKKLLKLQAQGKIGDISYEPLPNDAITAVSGKNFFDMVFNHVPKMLKPDATAPHEEASMDKEIGNKVAKSALIDKKIEGEEASKNAKEKLK